MLLEQNYDITMALCLQRVLQRAKKFHAKSML